MADVKKEIMYNGNKYILESTDNSVIETDDPVNQPSHYKQGNRETIEVIKDYMTDDEFVGYLKGNVIKYVGRFKFKGNPLQDLKKASWYLNKLIKETESWDK
jgi:predicted HAD superfamily phosphohydrolase